MEPCSQHMSWMCLGCLKHSHTWLRMHTHTHTHTHLACSVPLSFLSSPCHHRQQSTSTLRPLPFSAPHAPVNESRCLECAQRPPVPHVGLRPGLGMPLNSNGPPALGPSRSPKQSSKPQNQGQPFSLRTWTSASRPSYALSEFSTEAAHCPSCHVEVLLLDPFLNVFVSVPDAFRVPCVCASVSRGIGGGRCWPWCPRARCRVWCGVVLWCVVLCYVVWCGVVWCGVVWCVVWCYFVCGVVRCGVPKALLPNGNGWDGLAYRANFEFLAKYLIHSLDSGDFSVSAKKKN